MGDRLCAVAASRCRTVSRSFAARPADPHESRCTDVPQSPLHGGTWARSIGMYHYLRQDRTLQETDKPLAGPITEATVIRNLQ